MLEENYYIHKARDYVETLCSVVPNRRTGSAGNKVATNFFAGQIQNWGFDVDTTPFPCFDHETGEAFLHRGRNS